ncbi:MAG: RNA repair transcriptional activator RtcR [Fuerstiella sp.]
MKKKTVVIGILGTQLDAGRDRKRWEKWRPTVSACQHDDLLIDHFELLYPISHHTLAKSIKADLTSVSPETNVQLHNVEFEDAWDFEEVFGTLHEFARGYEFNTEANDYLIHITTGSHVQQICLFLLTESRHLPGTLLQTSPPKRKMYGTHPGTYSIIDLDLSRYDALAARFAVEQQEGQQFLKSGIETRNKAFNDMIERIERVVIASTAPILLTGPTGAGKTHLARKIYELKRRREQIRGDFVEVNCATLRGDQTMSALFGHVKGAFTGAAVARMGLLKSADGGLLFLDEIGELGLDEQAMLLRAIEEKRFLPVGSDKESEADFQLIAGTNRELTERVAAGLFREDLFARINLWTFQLPGLAHRVEDIEPNLEFELERQSGGIGQKTSMTREARQEFLDWATSTSASWSANFRDLTAAVTRMATLAGDGRIGVEEVREEIQRLSESWGTDSGGIASKGLQQFLTEDQIAGIDLFDQAQLAAVLGVCRQEKTLAAAGRRLFAVSRRTRSSTNDSDRLRKYLARFELDWKTVCE